MASLGLATKLGAVPATDSSTPGSTLIVGTGLVGASIGMALSARDERVHLADRVRSHAIVAAGLGAGTIEPPDPDDVTLVVVAVPPDALASVIAKALVRYPRATVTDVGSVKSLVANGLNGTAGVDRYVPSHPMAGSQFTGPITASPHLFVDRTWVVTPLPTNAPDHVARIERLATLCGARVVTMSPDEHDVAVAQVSHLPHLMSILTAGHLREVPADHLRLAGQGIRDVTRIAGSDPALWRQILTANRAAVRAELSAVADDLAELLAVLDDEAGLESFLARGRAGALSLPGKHGQAPQDYAAVVVEIPDEPRALARLFTDVADLGVNVEDVAIEHDQERQVGFLAIQVVPDAAERLAADIVGRGWNLRG